MTPISPQQCRAARAFLGWSRKELSTAANVAENTIADFERGNRSTTLIKLRYIKFAFEDSGLRILGGGGIAPIV